MIVASIAPAAYDDTSQRLHVGGRDAPPGHRRRAGPRGGRTRGRRLRHIRPVHGYRPHLRAPAWRPRSAASSPTKNRPSGPWRSPSRLVADARFDANQDRGAILRAARRPYTVVCDAGRRWRRRRRVDAAFFVPKVAKGQERTTGSSRAGGTAPEAVEQIASATSALASERRSPRYTVRFSAEGCSAA
jgi:hypothetical protein